MQPQQPAGPRDEERPSESGPRAVLTGKLLSGRWRVGRLLGRGGMSEVYAATHRNGKAVAIKVLHAELAGSQTSRRRFLREGYIANRVGHDGVVSVIDDDINDDGTVFLVMDLLEGKTLEQHCVERGGILPANEVLAVAEAVLDVLVAAHEKGIVHRDIKPSNVFLTAKGTMKLLDFGIASLREMSASGSTTRTGFVLGTPGFIAPEQARGRWKEIDARTDLWGLGAMMFRLLSGRAVHEGETTNEAVIAAATQDAVPLASVVPSVPEGVAALVDRALRQKPLDRWPSAAEMQQAVHRERAKLPVTTLPTPRVQRDLATLDEPMSLQRGRLTADALSAATSIATPEPRDEARWVAGRRTAFVAVAIAMLLVAVLVASRTRQAPVATEHRLPDPVTEPAAPSANSRDSEKTTTPVPSAAALETPVSEPNVNRPAAPVAGPRTKRRARDRDVPRDAASATAAPLPTPTRARLEDVLDERQ